MVLIGTVGLHAQQDPQYTQYMYNMNVMNPAYAGSFEGLSLGALYRSQWVGVDGAPKTATFNGHMPVGRKVGLGLSFINDQIGPVKENNAYVDFSYTLELGSGHKLAMGVKAGATFYDVGLTGLERLDADDPLLGEDVNSVSPNVGAGFYLYKPDTYYVSLSMPNIISTVHLDAENGKKIGSETQHFFAAAGYVFGLSDNFKLKPHAMLKMAFDAPMTVDGNLNLFMYDIVEVGVGYRLEDSWTAMVNFMITPQLRVGYAYDHIVSDLDINANASHEIFLNFDILLSRKVSRSPRYF